MTYEYDLCSQTSVIIKLSQSNNILINFLCNWTSMFTIYLHGVQFILKICKCYYKFRAIICKFFTKFYILFVLFCLCLSDSYFDRFFEILFVLYVRVNFRMNVCSFFKVLHDMLKFSWVTKWSYFIILEMFWMN